uniref:C2 domain-containing protein n=1 Tax=Amphilophus citrinellus TaxID=61819 RepID=A0A3Q0SL75_AMPCI
MASILPLLLLVLCSLNVAHCGLRVYKLYARGLRPDQNSSADGYVEMSCGSSYVKTRVNENNPNPSWTEELSYSRAVSGDRLEFRVYDKDVAFNDRLGVCSHSIRKGSYSYSCNLEKGGVFYFSYTLS